MSNLFKRFRTFLALSISEKWLLVEAFLQLAKARVTIAFRDFGDLASQPDAVDREENDSNSLGATDRETVSSIRWAVGLMVPKTPWQSRCLVQALAARAMLLRRRIPARLCLGVRKDDNKKLIAHAWLQCGPIMVTGGAEATEYKVLASFSDDWD
jgi:hypothetical protein